MIQTHMKGLNLWCTVALHLSWAYDRQHLKQEQEARRPNEPVSAQLSLTSSFTYIMYRITLSCLSSDLALCLFLKHVGGLRIDAVNPQESTYYDFGCVYSSEQPS